MPASIAAAAQAAMAAMLNDISERTPLNCKGRRSRDLSIKNAVKISTASISGRPMLANRVRWTTAACKSICGHRECDDRSTAGRSSNE